RRHMRCTPPAVITRRFPAVHPTRVGAFGIAAALHAAALVAAAWIQCGIADPHDADEAVCEIRVAVRAADLDDPVEIVRQPTFARDTVPPPRAGDDPLQALVPDEADDLPPPAAAASIAVPGGAHAPAPSEWEPRP